MNRKPHHHHLTFLFTNRKVKNHLVKNPRIQESENMDRWTKIQNRWKEENYARQLNTTEKFLHYWDLWKSADGKRDYIYMGPGWNQPVYNITLSTKNVSESAIEQFRVEAEALGCVVTEENFSRIETDKPIKKKDLSSSHVPHVPHDLEHFISATHIQTKAMFMIKDRTD